LAIARATNDKIEEVEARTLLAEVYRALGDYERAMHLLELSLSHVQKNHTLTKIEGNIRGGKGNTYYSMGKYKEAAICYEQALRLFQAIWHRDGQIICLENLAYIRLIQQNTTLALQLIQEIEYLATEMGILDTCRLSHLQWIHGVFVEREDKRNLQQANRILTGANMNGGQVPTVARFNRS
jgi:tetratricopeptide (TPR) repeat protein